MESELFPVKETSRKKRTSRCSLPKRKWLYGATDPQWDTVGGCFDFLLPVSDLHRSLTLDIRLEMICFLRNSEVVWFC